MFESNSKAERDKAKKVAEAYNKNVKVIGSVQVDRRTWIIKEKVINNQ